MASNHILSFVAKSGCTPQRELVRTYYYNAPVNREDDEEKYKSQQRFFDELKKLPDLQLRLGRLEHRDGGVIEKGVDIYLAVDMLRYAYNDIYDVAILISSDGDFSEAVNAVKDLGKHVEYAHFAMGISKHLMDCCDRHILLTNELLSSCFTH
ncbi:MAG: NYN domain-containing protein [Methanoregula sp.]|jgi:uncharacterized LabA/DUF88 family protein|nr:NYN domain-containing protein [Methanoregula sp.]